MMNSTHITKLLAVGVITLLSSACVSNGIAEPRSTSTYSTTGFGGSQQEASTHAVSNANMTCGNLPVNVVSDSVNETKYQDTSTTDTMYEVNLRYQCDHSKKVIKPSYSPS